MKSLLNSMKSSKDLIKEQGRAIARGVAEEQARKERNKAIAEKRKASAIRNAAERMFNQN